MANPSGTRTPSGESDRIISPKDAFFPPTSPTSARPIWENQRTKRMRAPPSSEHVFTTGGPRIGRSFWNGPLAGSLAAGVSARSHRYAREGQPHSLEDFSMRRIWWMAAVPALLFGCASSKSDTKMSESAKTQTAAQASLQKAADAQKHALEEQQKAEQLQQEVVQKQKDLADAQARLQGQRAKAEQAQRDARTAADEAHREAQQQQGQAMQMQKSEAQTHQQINQQNQQAWTQAKNVSGRAVSASSDEVLVRSSDQGDLRLKLNDSTAITVDGRMGKVDDIKPGGNVRAAYQVIDGQPTALRLDVTNNRSSTGTGTSGSSSSSGTTNPNTGSTGSSSGDSSSGD